MGYNIQIADNQLINEDDDNAMRQYEFADNQLIGEDDDNAMRQYEYADNQLIGEDDDNAMRQYEFADNQLIDDNNDMRQYEFADDQGERVMSKSVGDYAPNYVIPPFAKAHFPFGNLDERALQWGRLYIIGVFVHIPRRIIYVRVRLYRAYIEHARTNNERSPRPCVWLVYLLVKCWTLGGERERVRVYIYVYV